MSDRRSPALDDVSKAIIERLQRDGRRSYADIGREVGLSEAAVRQRVQRLTESGVMQIVGMPAPPFWGIYAFLMNFILYLGPITVGLTLLVTGLVIFDGAYAVLPAALYFGMNAMEGQFVTPSLVGQQMRVNPLIVFLSLVFWLFLWGPIGAIIANQMHRKNAAFPALW